MEHVNQEWLAELVDREPTAEERALLEEHPEWQRDLDAYREMTEALGRMDRMRPPRGHWDVLEARLASEGLIKPRRNTLLSLPLSAGWTRAAAAAALFLGGAFTGSSLTPAAGAPGLPGGSSLADVAAISDVEEAEQAVQAAESQYLNSLMRYSQLRQASDEPFQPDLSERSEALDMLVQASQNALRRAPDDPFINMYLVNTLAERSRVQRAARSGDNWF